MTRRDPETGKFIEVPDVAKRRAKGRVTIEKSGTVFGLV